jgi:hypothetical protein
MKKLTNLLLVAIVAVPLAGCVVHGDGRVHTGVVVSTPGVVVHEAPPPPPVYVAEVRPGFVWIDGRYHYRGGRYVWVAGRYERERAGHVWVPGRWSRGPRGHYYVDGRWEARGRVHHPRRGPVVRDNRRY